MLTLSSKYSLPILRVGTSLLGWLIFAAILAPPVVFMAHSGLNQKADDLLHHKGIHIATPGLVIGGKTILPSKTIYYWQPPLAGQEIPAGAAGGTGLNETPIERGMTIAGFTVTSGFGPRSAPCAGCSSNHRGVDLNTPTGTPLKAFLPGTKVTCWWDGGGGGGQVASIWIGPEFYQALHLSSCRNGTYGPGEVFARTGATGRGTGAHLHWEQKVGGEKVKPKVGVLEAILKGEPPAGFNPAGYGTQAQGSAPGGAASFVAKWEGFRPCPYLDPVGVPTIGYGTTRYPDGRAVAMGDRCVSEAEAKGFKEQDLAKFNQMAREVITQPMTPAQATAWTSFFYNVGSAGKNSTAVRRFNSGDLQGAADAIKQWNKGEVNGRMVVLPGLVNRRAEEAELLKQ